MLGVLTWRQAAVYTSSDTYYRAVLAGNPSSAFAQFNLAVDLKARGQVDEAIQHMEEAIQLRPEKAEIQYFLANELKGRGRIDEAIQHYEEALRLEPDLVEAHYGLAVVLASRGRTDEARAHYGEVVRLNPDFAKTHADPFKIFSSSRSGSSNGRE